jgi:murein DD-endopeptidase MepM/ murein hydrolase activator NlpD
MNIKIGMFFCLALVSAMGVNGKEPVKKPEPAPSATALQMQLMDQQVSEWMADRGGIKKELAGEELAKIETATFRKLVEYEDLQFPADELYGSWDTCWVNPYRNGKELTVPDSFQIDCNAFTIPVDNEIKVTSKYGPRRRRMHRGIDLKVQIGDTIRAAFSGKVRIKSYERRGYGKYLVIRHPNGLETIYGHLSNYLVDENEIVTSGQPIALGGNTGRSTGSHLHFETRFLGQAIDPSDIIDFTNGTPHQDYYVFYKGSPAKSGNIYTSTSERIVYHRVKQGETLSHIAKKYHTSVSELCRLNGISKTSRLRIGQSIRCGTAAVKQPKKETNTLANPAISASGDSTQQASASYHKVQANETLSSIARKYGTTVDALCKLNNLQATNPLTPGQDICYRKVSKPASRTKGTTDATVQTESKSAETDDATEIAAASENKEPEAVKNVAAGQSKEIRTTAAKSDKPIYHRVKQGDTLGAIARKYGITVDRLCEMNQIQATTILRIGRSLRCS